MYVEDNQDIKIIISPKKNMSVQ